MSFKPLNKKRPFDTTKPNKLKQRRPKRGDDEEYDDPDESKPRPRTENKKLVFDDEGNTIEAPVSNGKSQRARHQSSNQPDIDTKWYQVVSYLKFFVLTLYIIRRVLFQFAAFNKSGELLDMKEIEVRELMKTCRTCFEAELSSLQKRKSIIQY